MKVGLDFQQACTALERAIDRVDGKPRLKDGFADLGHIPEYAGKDVGVAVSDLTERLKAWDGPVPSTLLDKLDLGPECNALDVAAAVDVLLNTPIVMTSDEEADVETTILKLSEVSEEINADNPDLPPIPVAYPKQERTKH